MEVNTLIRLRHPNIVKLLGVCVEGDQRIGVFELLSRGSLAGALTGPDQASGGSGRAAPARVPPRQVLGWHERVQIALGIARGLAHMHKVCCWLKMVKILLSCSRCILIFGKQTMARSVIINMCTYYQII